MENKKILLLAIAVLIFSFAGCGQQPQKGNSDTAPPTQAENTMPDEQRKENDLSGTGADKSPIPSNQGKEDESPKEVTDGKPSEADELFELSNLEGTVTEFSEDGCKLSPTIESGDEEAYQAAPGYEDTFVSVIYNPDCTFQIANLSIQTSAVTYEPAAVKDVKKQTSLILCGEYDENEVFHASRVYIYRYI